MDQLNRYQPYIRYQLPYREPVFTRPSPRIAVSQRTMIAVALPRITAPPWQVSRLKVQRRRAVAPALRRVVGCLFVAILLSGEMFAQSLAAEKGGFSFIDAAEAETRQERGSRETGISGDSGMVVSGPKPTRLPQVQPTGNATTAPTELIAQVAQVAQISVPVNRESGGSPQEINGPELANGVVVDPLERKNSAGRKSQQKRMFLSRSHEEREQIQNRRAAPQANDAAMDKVNVRPFLGHRRSAVGSSSPSHFRSVGQRQPSILSPSDLPVDGLPIINGPGTYDHSGAHEELPVPSGVLGEPMRRQEVWPEGAISSQPVGPVQESVMDGFGAPVVGEIGGSSAYYAAGDFAQSATSAQPLPRLKRLRQTFGRAVRATVRGVLDTRQRVDAGLGSILVPNAAQIIDTTQPIQQYRFRSDFGYGLDFADRSEFFIASPSGGGPGFGGTTEYQEYSFTFEVGNDSFSVATELPVRSFDPELGGGHTGFGDIRVVQKTRLLDGERWQVSQLFRLLTPTGNSELGIGTGHVSVEPGVLVRWQQNCGTYWHGELKYRIPIAGDPINSGDVLQYGLGVSTVWYETLDKAVIPTLELVSAHFLNGQTTGPMGPLSVDGDASVSIHPGVRLAWDRGGDLGITELGISSGFGLSGPRQFDQLLRLELRFTK